MEFRILGPVEAWDDGAEVPLEGAKQRTVLAVLLLAQGRMVSDAMLSARVWGDGPPNTSAAQLYTYVSRLRRHLCGAVEIVRRRPGYALDTRDALVDHDEFERLSKQGSEAMRAGRFGQAARDLRSAGDLWRGPALANVTDHLTDVEVPRLEEARMLALESRIEAEFALGRHSTLVVELTGLVNEYPLRERLRAQLMIALFQDDRQAEAFAAYQHGRDVLVAELGVEPGLALREAYRVILAATPAQPAPVSAGRAMLLVHYLAPAMLPGDTPDFVGRGHELARIGSLMSPSLDAGREDERPRQVLVTGMAGTGKSALAVRAGHLYRDECPDGQLYMDLGGADQPDAEPVHPTDALSWFLKALGAAEADVPEDIEERTQVYRSWLAEKRMLVVLVNAVSDRQIRPLLPGGPHCRVIVTTEASLTALTGAEVINLGMLAPGEGVRLLGRIVGAGRVAAEQECAARLVEFCGHLPLAVRIAGLRLVAAHQAPLSDLHDRLADDRSRLDELRFGELDVRAGLHLSYQRLTGAARRALCRLALPAMSEIPQGVAATVLNVPRQVARNLIDALAIAHLLDVVRPGDAGELYCRFHPLVRLFAHERAQLEEMSLTRRAELDGASMTRLHIAGEIRRQHGITVSAGRAAGAQLEPDQGRGTLGTS